MAHNTNYYTDTNQFRKNYVKRKTINDTTHIFRGGIRL